MEVSQGEGRVQTAWEAGGQEARAAYSWRLRSLVPGHGIVPTTVYPTLALPFP